jgi:gamma-glutamylcysteine synthetase
MGREPGSALFRRTFSGDEDMQTQSFLTLSDIVHFIETGFRSDQDLQTGMPRAVGLENEYILVSADGTIISPTIIENLWDDLIALQWEAIFSENTQTIVGVKKARPNNAVSTHAYDVITTDLGYAILEIDLAPAYSLHDAYVHLRALLRTVAGILERYQAYMLGYGVQPVTGPSPLYMGKSSRYKMFWDMCNEEHQNTNHPYRVDLHTIDAACQTHVEVSASEVIPVMNVLNATAGLRIALLANSPIWRGQASGYQAIRQLFVEWSWPSRTQQMGIPPRFWDLEHYINFLLDLKAMFVQRDQQLYRINNQLPFRRLFVDPEGMIGVSADGQTRQITAELEDIYTQNGCSWFCVRPQPAYGTIEDRVSCQQPPQEPLCASALTLGLVENYQELTKLASILSLDQWRSVRSLASKSALRLRYPYLDLYPNLKYMLDVAQRGLLRRNLGEEVFLNPLYRRLGQQRSPADDIRALFCSHGLDALVAYSDMRLMS